ncbi:MAG: hypothetical protein R3191_00090 [Anaerolineales bacterium]|nr:hypothetical protein [Anaerolineales bacterium]
MNLKFHTNPITVLCVLLLIALLAIGTAQTRWDGTMEIASTVNTGTAAITFDRAFTNDDGVVDDEQLDSGDTGDCPAGRSTDSSCDPTGEDGSGPSRRQRDLASCTVELTDGASRALLLMEGAYPGYFCHSWYEIKNIGSVPLIVSSVPLNGETLPIDRQRTVDLDANETRDIQLHLTGFELCQQLDPGDFLQPSLRTRVLGGIPQLQSLSFEIGLNFLQWNTSCEQDPSQSGLSRSSPDFKSDPGTGRTTAGPGLLN